MIEGISHIGNMIVSVITSQRNRIFGRDLCRWKAEHLSFHMVQVSTWSESNWLSYDAKHSSGNILTGSGNVVRYFLKWFAFLNPAQWTNHETYFGHENPTTGTKVIKQNILWVTWMGSLMNFLWSGLLCGPIEDLRTNLQWRNIGSPI